VEFTQPLMLLWVALVPLLLLGHWGLSRRQRRIAERFADARLFEQLVVRPSAWQRALPVACYLIGILLLAVAMARPVAAIPLPVNRAAVIIAIDTSKSMMATDVPPTRLEAARRAAREFADLVPRSTKIGLVAFSEYGTVLLPPTTDRTALYEALDRLQTQSATSVGGVNPEPGLPSRSKPDGAVRTPITRLRLRAELVEDESLRAKFAKDLAEMEAMTTAALDFLRGVRADEPVQPVDVLALLESGKNK